MIWNPFATISASANVLVQVYDGIDPVLAQLFDDVLHSLEIRPVNVPTLASYADGRLSLIHI